MLEIADIVETVRLIEHHKGKFIKILLTHLEQNGKLDKETRKVALDTFNNFSRAVQKELGYVVEI